MAAVVKTVGVVGTGVIGASWTAIFLARGLRVLVSDPAPDAEKKLNSYLQSVWPGLERNGLTLNASLSNCKFVGSTLAAHYGEVDFIQEVWWDQSFYIVELTRTERTRAVGPQDQIDRGD